MLQILRQMKDECCIVQPKTITSPQGRALLKVSDCSRPRLIVRLLIRHMLDLAYLTGSVLLLYL